MDISDIMNSIDKFNKKNIQIRIDNDNQTAMIMLKTLGPGETDYTVEEMNNFLDASGIKMGIDTNAICTMISNKLYETHMVIATGKHREDGQDGYYEYKFNTKIDPRPVMNKDGSVDYYNTKKFETVVAGDVLAVYHQPTKGTFGYDVKGRLLTPVPGKKMMPLRGKGFTVSDDGSKYIASVEGKIDYRNGEINISEVYEVAGDISVDIGNIEFSGDIRVSGNIISGVIVSAQGNVYVGGHVESAVISAGKDIVFNGGVNAKSGGLIEAKGDIYGKFFENAKIHAGGTVHANYIYNSEIVAMGKVIAEGRKASIIGGDITGILGVETGNCGNDALVTTNIRVGATKLARKEYANLIMKIKEIDSQLEIFEDAIRRMVKNSEIGKESLDKNMYTRLFQAKVIKAAEKAKYESERKYMFNLIRESTSSGLSVNNIIYPGTKLFIETKIYEPPGEFIHSFIRMYNDEIIMRDFDGEYKTVL